MNPTKTPTQLRLTHGQLRPQDTAALRRLVHDLPEPTTSPPAPAEP
jgi:hypothetical protein